MNNTMQTAIEWHFIPELPFLEKIDGWWGHVPVLIAQADDRVVGAYFQKRGEDNLYPDDPVTASFVTDEGLAYNDVVAWAYMPEHPKKILTDYGNKMPAISKAYQIVDDAATVRANEEAAAEQAMLDEQTKQFYALKEAAAAKEREKKVQESVEAVIGNKPVDLEKLINGARLSEEAIQQLRKQLGLKGNRHG